MNTISAFTKPWPGMPIDELAATLAEAGLDGVELCVRKGYQVYSDNLSRSLSEACKAMAARNIVVTGASGPLDEEFLSACGDNGIPMVRILLPFSDRRDIDASIDASKRTVEAAMKIAERNNVVIGIQEHVDNVAFNTELLYLLVKYFDSPYVRAIWDSAQSAMAGEDWSFGLGFILPYCCSINLKNIVFTNPGVAFVPGDEGILKWNEIISGIVKEGYSGNITLTHEYTDQSDVAAFLRRDCALCRSALGGCL